jgi:hypothetical protein
MTPLTELALERAFLIGQLQKYFDKYPNVHTRQLRSTQRVTELEIMIARIEQRMLSEESAAIAAFRP